MFFFAGIVCFFIRTDYVQYSLYYFVPQLHRGFQGIAGSWIISLHGPAYFVKHPLSGRSGDLPAAGSFYFMCRGAFLRARASSVAAGSFCLARKIMAAMM